MNLFKTDLACEPKKIEKNRSNNHKQFRITLGELVDSYLKRKISFLAYIERMYEIHRRFKRKGFSKQDLIRERERFFTRKHKPMRVF